MAARAVDDDLPHRRGGHGEEVRAIPPLRPGLIDELEVGLVDQGGRVEGGAGRAAGQTGVRHRVQAIVDQRDELVEGVPVPASQGQESLRDLAGGLHRMSGSGSAAGST
jgi:hypothetical protein